VEPTARAGVRTAVLAAAARGALAGVGAAAAGAGALVAGAGAVAAGDGDGAAVDGVCAEAATPAKVSPAATAIVRQRDMGRI
jgi:hypothetical protein